MERSSSIYKALDSTKNEIRLLGISSSLTLGEQLHCTLAKVSLDDEDTYFDALSYTSGNPKELTSIRVNGIETLIRCNLYEALNTFRKLDNVCGRLLWADTLCIDQQNLLERAEQVQIMGRVYREAGTVRIWLGQLSESSEIAMRYLNDVILDKVTPDIWHMETDTVDALAIFLGQPWWSRIWVIQEAALAKIPILYCGTEATAFRSGVLKAAARILQQTAGEAAVVEQSVSNQRSHLVTEIQANLMRFLYADGLMRRQNERSLSGNDVAQFLEMVSDCEATDPRDCVYGLLGLLPESIGIQVDYKSPLEAVHEHTTFAVMLWAKSLALLHLVGQSKSQARVRTGKASPCYFHPGFPTSATSTYTTRLDLAGSTHALAMRLW